MTFLVTCQLDEASKEEQIAIIQANSRQEFRQKLRKVVHEHMLTSSHLADKPTQATIKIWFKAGRELRVWPEQ